MYNSISNKYSLIIHTYSPVVSIIVASHRWWPTWLPREMVFILSKHLGPFRLWKLSLTFCSLIFTIDIAKKRQPKALEWNSEFGWQVLEAKKYHTILLPCYLKMVHLHIHLYKKCIWTIFISIQRIEYHIYIPINMF